MTRIDRYLLFLYIRVLTICFASVSGLLIVVHVFSNLDEFFRFAEQNETSMLAVLGEYYGPYMLWIFERLSGLLALLALLFVVAWLNKTNEFTALLAAGITKRRVIRPLLLASACVVLAAAATREFSIPRFQDRLDRHPQDLTGDFQRPMRPTFEQEAMALFQGKYLLTVHSKIIAPLLSIQGGPLAATFGSKIVAESATHVRATQDTPCGYLFQNVTAPNNIDAIPSAQTVDGKPILLTSKDTPWIQPGNCFLVSDTEFEMLRGGSAWKQFASTSELITHLQGENARSGNDLRVQIHGRILRPLIDWTVLLLGVPVLLTRPDRHMFWVAGACLFIVAFYTAVVMGLSALGGTGVLSPILATWLPLIVFFPWGWAKTGAAMES